MSYRYDEPKEAAYEPLPEGDYGFTVVSVEPTYNNEKGTFILPVEIHLADTQRKIKCWLSAGYTQKNEPFDMIAPFLKSVRRNPAVGEEPDFSSRNIIGSTGVAHIKEKPYKGDKAEYEGMSFPAVAYWKYDKQQAQATTSGGKEAKDREYGKTLPAMQSGKLQPPEDTDDVPF